MSYNFSELCADHLEKHEKRLTSLKKAFIKELSKAITIINDPVIIKRRGEIKTVIDDIFNDENNKSLVLYGRAMNTIQLKLTSNFNLSIVPFVPPSTETK